MAPCVTIGPQPPIWPEDLPLIRELLTDEEYAALLKRMVQVLPNGPDRALVLLGFRGLGYSLVRWRKVWAKHGTRVGCVFVESGAVG